MSAADIDRFVAREAIAARLMASARILAGEMDSPQRAEEVSLYVQRNYGDTSAAQRPPQPH